MNQEAVLGCDDFTMIDGSTRCIHHPDRPAYARCMSCDKHFCQACVTTWEGIFYCAECLAAKREASVETIPIFGWVMVTVLVIGLWITNAIGRSALAMLLGGILG
ncbi:MAG: B-box zinc finger protein [Acidobacteriota bacterium]